MSVRLEIGGKPAYTFLSTASAEEFIEAQTEAVRRRWPMKVITSNEDGRRHRPVAGSGRAEQTGRGMGS